MAHGSGPELNDIDAEIGRLRGLISEMGGRAESAIDNAMIALTKRDNQRASRVVADDKRIDALETEVDRYAVAIIAHYAPRADELRQVVAAIKIAGVIERIADYAKNIARRVSQIERETYLKPISLLPAMGDMVGEMVRDVLDAFAARDADQALEVWQRDGVVDDFYNSIFRALVTFMMENPQTIGEAAHLLFIAKHLERIGDHATNVAEMVYYAATGAYLVDRERGTAPGDDPGIAQPAFRAGAS